ncbi:hypothetical protein J113_24125 [Mycobacterium tuberculosis CAS/NITR204]|uniref:Uncharacterized protein n=1 Tax=Mycobacterium tuberculosis CAS/NITR204 TaxID=1310114 RepID=R4MJA7_MYCTX|nr:hypothetical protein J113_24125 [Mycobacterium tuberculosis CAS/NITR204]COW32504.1 Uncharacterised protein [Mycobacterium tuberculosis]COX83717.1 Uncharacterised protein [Mycobacterium tuberculosis]
MHDDRAVTVVDGHRSQGVEPQRIHGDWPFVQQRYLVVDRRQRGGRHCGVRDYVCATTQSADGTRTRLDHRAMWAHGGGLQAT